MTGPSALILLAASLAAAAELPADAGSDDPLRPFTTQLEKKYGVLLEASPAQCSCFQYEVSRKAKGRKEDERLGVIKAEEFGRGCGETEVALERGVRRALSLPRVSSGTATDETVGGFGVSISSEAQALMNARGMVLAGNILHAGTKKQVADVDLDGDGKTQSVTLRLDETDPRVLVVTSINQDATREVVKIVGGRAVR